MPKYLVGGEQTTVNSTITELFPALWFNNNNKPPRTTGELTEFIKKVKLDSANSKKSFVATSMVSDMKQAAKFISQAFSLIEPKMLKTKLDNAFGITKYIYETNASNPISKVVWGYRAKPAGVPTNHAGDIFLMFADKSIAGISLKAGTAKSSEPKLNSYVRTTLMKPYWQKLDPKADDKLKLALWKNVYSKIPGLPETVTKNNYYSEGRTAKINPELDAAMLKLFKTDPDEFDSLYQIQNKVSKEALIKLINSSVKVTKQWINEEFRLEKPQVVPLILVKAVGDQAEEQGDKLVNFLSKVTEVKAYINKNSVQEWFIDVSDSKGKTLTLLMTIRSDSEYRAEKRKGKLGALAMLKLLYRGVKK
jgi:hypothetical protein